jgi:hypothetical protein
MKKPERRHEMGARKLLCKMMAAGAMVMLIGQGPVSAEEPVTPGEARAIAEEAYIFAYPMMENYKTLYAQIVLTGSPFNVFFHRHQLLGPDFKGIVGPNNDTLYSPSWLDLRSEPLVISVPEIPEDRYYSLQFIDLYVYNFAYIGQRETGNKAGSYLIAGPDQTIPEVPGISRAYQSESDFVFCIGRILAKDEKDQQIAAGLQRQFKIQPLSDFIKGRLPEGPSGPVDFPVYDPAKVKSEFFVDYFNFLLRFTKIHSSDEPAFERFRKIGIGTANQNALAGMKPAMVTAIREGVEKGHEKITDESKRIGSRVAGWNTTFKGFGTREMINGNHLTHAAAAKIALYGNNREENSGFSRFVDADRLPLDGAKNRYAVCFQKGQLPPVKAFWSLTLYRRPEILLSANVLDRYSIGDRTPGLQFGPDGSLTLYIQHESPGKDLESNWLPAPEGEFALSLRTYLPEASILDGSWQPPEVIRIKK